MFKVEAFHRSEAGLKTILGGENWGSRVERLTCLPALNVVQGIQLFSTGDFHEVQFPLETGSELSIFGESWRCFEFSILPLRLSSLVSLRVVNIPIATH